MDMTSKSNRGDIVLNNGFCPVSFFLPFSSERRGRVVLIKKVKGRLKINKRFIPLLPQAYFTCVMMTTKKEAFYAA